MKMNEEKLDYIIDKLDLGFMRNRIKASEEEQGYFLNSFAGITAAIQYDIKECLKKVFRHG